VTVHDDKQAVLNVFGEVNRDGLCQVQKGLGGPSWLTRRHISDLPSTLSPQLGLRVGFFRRRWAR
ncbi:MAG: hypothetical protein QW104_05775, partial [Nitrososphaerota archaeon]